MSTFWLYLTITVSLVAASVDKCGVSKYADNPFVPRIVGGQNAEPNEWPWQISIQLTHPQFGFLGHWCGGVLIDKQWIVTAAHCIINPLFVLPHAQFWKVRVGEHHMKKEEGNEKTYDVSNVYYNHWYSQYDNDIAMMRLSQPIDVNDNVQPICLPDKDETFMGADCAATGWGKVDFDKKGSSILKEVSVQVYDNSVCHNAYNKQFQIGIKDWHLCAGTLAGGKGTCHGDSGGPLQCKKGNKWYLAGITSFGSGCAKVGFPDVYSRITYFLKWIDSNKAFHP